jgi:Glycosyl transferase family 2
MVTSASSDPMTTVEPEAAVPVILVPPPSGSISARIDFAHLAGNRLVVYGWVLGLANQIESASIQIESYVIDVVGYATRVRRPDVAHHFSLDPVDDEHGFYTLVELPSLVAKVDHLGLTIVLLSGEVQESRWPVQQHDLLTDSIPQAHITTLRALLRSLPGEEGKRLKKFLARGTRAGQHADLTAALPPPMQFEIDFICVLEDRIVVVYGWLSDPADELVSLHLSVGGCVFDFLENSISIPRPDFNPDPVFYRRRESARLPGLIFAQAIPAGHVMGGEAVFAITAQSDDPVYVARPVCWNAHDSRRELFVLLSKIDVESTLVLIERIRSAMEGVVGMQSLRALLELNHDRAAEHLPESISQSGHWPGYRLHLDKVIPVAEQGIFLNGWLHAGADTAVRVVCHCGSASYVINEDWLRHTRKDVTSYLASQGIQTDDHEHGFSCYVPLKRGDSPYWLSITSESGEVCRMRVPVAERSHSGLQTVRSLLSTFHCEYRELRSLLDRQIGPAVQAAWLARAKPLRREFVESFGVRPTDPQVSIIVPLFGRWDFAEYQMALFADDPDFQRIELMYVVDDPAIFDAFRHACPDLHGIYQVPFTLAFSGTNMGFAGANNFGAGHARGQYLLLLNSDVLPKRRGWVGELVRIQQSIERPGLLGAKLLYEDGSLQHAGITFRRHLPWGGLWINDHPWKGQSPATLTGTREVGAVTAACALLEADLYRELDGLSEDYIIGDFEDSDLCLRTLRAGRRNHIALDVELYHLERQSQNQIGDSAWRSNLTAYNCWLHNQRWAALIEQTSMNALSSPKGVS